MRQRLLVAIALAFICSCSSDNGGSDDGDVDIGADAADVTIDAPVYDVGQLEPRAETPPDFVAVWAEFMTDEEVIDSLPLLREHHLALNLAWTVDRLDDPALFDIVGWAQAYEVPVNPWLLLEESDGYWPGSTNAQLFADTATELMDLWDERGLSPTTLIVDMEMEIERAEQLTVFLEGDTPDITGLVEFLRAGVDEEQFAEATSIYADLADAAHDRGWQVLLTTLPMILDDYEDEDDTIRQALGIPVDDIDWDVMTFQVYRTLLGRFSLSDAEPTSYLIYDYALTAIELFGERAGLDLGLVGTGVSGSPTYESPAMLLEDIEAGLAAGIPRTQIQVYNWDGIVERTPSEDWLLPVQGTPEAPPEGEATSQLRGTISALDLTN